MNPATDLRSSRICIRFGIYGCLTSRGSNQKTRGTQFCGPQLSVLNSLWRFAGVAAGIVRRFIYSDDVTVSDDGMMSQRGRDQWCASCSHCGCILPHLSFPSPRLFFLSNEVACFPRPSICQPFRLAPALDFLFASSTNLFHTISIHPILDLNELVISSDGSQFPPGPILPTFSGINIDFIGFCFCISTLMDKARFCASSLSPQLVPTL
ncbi:hypothetical protein V8F20_000507 [Naviculisporaceae sp. PSN 640]